MLQTTGIYPHTDTHTCTSTHACTHVCICTPGTLLTLIRVPRAPPADGVAGLEQEIPGDDFWRHPPVSAGRGCLGEGEGEPHVGLSCLLSPLRAQEPHSPSSAEAPYCDLPCCPPASQDPLDTTTCAGHSVEGLGLRQGSQRWVEPPAPWMGSLGGKCPHFPYMQLFMMAVSIYNSWHGSRGQPTQSGHRGL